MKTVKSGVKVISERDYGRTKDFKEEHPIVYFTSVFTLGLSWLWFRFWKF